MLRIFFLSLVLIGGEISGQSPQYLEKTEPTIELFSGELGIFGVLVKKYLM
jgi:hypothetical protein